MFMEIGHFLNQRLTALGIQHVFGVPGDFNLSYLEQIEEHDALEFVGNCNELNAAYAADGYARVHGFSALVTTYGVGDLSALNGIAGAYAENIPMVHISGIPPLHAVQSGALIHHTLVDGNYDNIMNCMKEFTVAQTRLTPANAAAEIDRVLKQCFLERRPVHIQLPSDITHIQIEVDEAPLKFKLTDSDPQILLHVVNEITTALAQAKKPIFLVDIEADRFGVTDLILAIAEKASIPFASLSTAKNIMNESSNLYLGTYVGGASQPHIRQAVEDSDCLISIGVRLTDVGTGYFTQQLPQKYIHLTRQHATVFSQDYPAVNLQQVLEGVYQQVPAKKVSKPMLETPVVEKNVSSVDDQDLLSHDVLWRHVGQFFQDQDIIIGEVGTSNSALSGVRLPQTAKYISQPVWGSIGYTLPALLGTLFAAPKRRQILFIGDGSIQLTIQELSTIIRHDLKPIIFVLNNGGYTIERLILGEKAVYNDIQNWNYTEIGQAFNGKNSYQKYIVETVGQLKSTLENLHQPDSMVVIELKLPAMDAPLSLHKFADAVAQYDYGYTGYQKLKKPTPPPVHKKAI